MSIGHKKIIYRSFLDNESDKVIVVFFDKRSLEYIVKIGQTELVLSTMDTFAKRYLRNLRDHLSAALIEWDRTMEEVEYDDNI